MKLGKSRARQWSAQDVMLSVDANGQTVLFHVQTGTYLRLDDSAARIVGMLNQDPDPEKAAIALATRFGISQERARTDVEWVIHSVGAMSARRASRGRLPTLSGFRSVFASWRRQKWPFRMLILKVTAVVFAVEMGLKLTNVATLARRLGVPLATEASRPAAVPLEHLSQLDEADQRTYLALWWVMNRWLYDGTCLRRSLTFGWFLRKRKPILRLGMTSDSDVIAHAWIEVDGKSIDSQSVTMDFTSITVKNKEESA